MYAKRGAFHPVTLIYLRTSTLSTRDFIKRLEASTSNMLSLSLQKNRLVWDLIFFTSARICKPSSVLLRIIFGVSLIIRVHANSNLQGLVQACHEHVPSLRFTDCIDFWLPLGIKKKILALMSFFGARVPDTCRYRSKYGPNPWQE